MKVTFTFLFHCCFLVLVKIPSLQDPQLNSVVFLKRAHCVNVFSLLLQTLFFRSEISEKKVTHNPFPSTYQGPPRSFNY